jgi:hypothetical protein
MTIVGFNITRDALLLGHLICDTVHTIRCLPETAYDSFDQRASAHFTYDLLRRWITPRVMSVMPGRARLPGIRNAGRFVNRQRQSSPQGHPRDTYTCTYNQHLTSPMLSCDHGT